MKSVIKIEILDEVGSVEFEGPIGIVIEQLAAGIDEAARMISIKNGTLSKKRILNVIFEIIKENFLDDSYDLIDFSSQHGEVER